MQKKKLRLRLTKKSLHFINISVEDRTMVEKKEVNKQQTVRVGASKQRSFNFSKFMADFTFLITVGVSISHFLYSKCQKLIRTAKNLWFSYLFSVPQKHFGAIMHSALNQRLFRVFYNTNVARKMNDYFESVQSLELKII